MEASAAELVDRVRQKDPDAFAMLVRRFERVAISVAFGVLNDASAAGDVSQDAFLRVWERLDDLREPARFGTWVCGIVRNLAIDRLRRRRHMEKLNADTSAAQRERWTRNPVDEACRRESGAMIAGAIEGLDDIARRAITLRYYDDLASKQIARQLGISADAVDMRLIRARKRLRAALPELASA